MEGMFEAVGLSAGPRWYWISSMDACFVYIYQYEPYLRDPVIYPKVQVRGQVEGGGHSPAVRI